jgi:hypothetical protein
VGLGIDDPVWVPTVFTKNRDRLLTTDIARQLLAAVLADNAVKPLLSDEHFSVDGTLIQAWASMKSFQPKETAGGGDAGPGEDGAAPAGAKADPGQDAVAPVAEAPASRNAEVNFHGQKRSNETHASRTDPEARLYRKGPVKEAKLCFMGHALMENRSGLIVEACLTQASGHAERVAALAMIEPRADRRKWIEEAFGWGKTIGPAARTMLRGIKRVGAQFTFTLAGDDLARLPKLLAA